MVNYLLQFGTGDPRTFTGLAPTFLIFKDKDGTNVTPPGITEVPSSTGLYYFAWGTTTNIAFLADAATTSPGTSNRYIAGMLDQADRIAEIGASLAALGTTSVALGTTNVALGTTNVALGTTNVALGTTAVSWGSALGSTLVATGSTLVAIGNTSIAYGGTNSANIVNMGATHVAVGNSLVALGNTSVAIGTTILSVINGLSLSIGTTASIIGDSTHDPVDLFGYLKRVSELLQGQQRFAKGTGALSMYERSGVTLLASRTVTNNASLVIKS
jgi:hypothetical protein